MRSTQEGGRDLGREVYIPVRFTVGRHVVYAHHVLFGVIAEPLRQPGGRQARWRGLCVKGTVQSLAVINAATLKALWNAVAFHLAKAALPFSVKTYTTTSVPGGAECRSR